MITRIFICILVTLFLLTAEQSATRAADKLTITMKVTAHGLQVSGIAMQNKRIMIPRGTRVRLVMEYADANRNTHQFTLTAKNTEITSPMIDGEARKIAALEFTAGDRGQEFYRLSCELPCIAMDDLIDYIFMVV
ncbi:hypothetical protein FBQ96_02195 [Nitrospirales bacterium NOB]|nr:hypothetical protein [Nitrospirota bacterium]MCE7966565.1 hypothetical protein [Nitrospira sp. NTP2]MCK6492058.1 hypothetical protein [Nitrospira sp.]MDL1888391.1 hypothetical protein [Nitrospirales bacterium NOB]QOJ35943.1 MAG: hypothetical protein HRU82_13750 [Nitrospira sp.]